MHRRTRAWITLTSLTLAAGAGIGVLAALPAPAETPAPTAAADTWTVDPVHSFVVFKIRHSGASNAYGMIHGPTGSFSIDAANPSASSIEVTLQAEKVDTGNDKRDQHIRSKDFFNAKEFPTISFKSTSFKSAGADKYEVAGDLTFRGETKPITATLTTIGSGKGMGGPVMGVEATFSIKRTDFGNKKYVAEGGLGDEVTLTVALEGGKK